MVEVRSIKVCPIEVSAGEICKSKISIPQFSPIKIRTSEIYAQEVCPV